MATSLIEVNLQFADGSSTKVEVERGTTAAAILDHDVLQLPAGYRARLVTERAEALEPDSQISEPQAWYRSKLSHCLGFRV